MKRFRWALLLLIAVAAVGAASSAVLAGSNKTTATYWNHVVTPATYPSAGAWLGYYATSTWTFDASELQGALPGSVSLNFAGLSKSLQLGGGSGYGTTVKVVVTGAATGTFTVTLANPWRPHVAYNASPGYGWQAFGSLTIPNSVWRNASSLTVKVTSMTSNTLVNISGGEGLMIGYATAE